MKLYNALSRKTEEFRPANGRVSIYVCGITPYDTTHLGHLFNYAFFDVLIRYLEWTGAQVIYVQNVTDIDDDILRKASEVGSDWRELGNRWTNHFIRDNRDLNMRPPDFLPRATEVVDDIISNVAKLLDSGTAYEVGGNVYFAIDKTPEYGQLSRLAYEEMLPVANERGNRPEDPNKGDPLDFVLWQAQAEGEPAWESPWGPGRPGWHIECSTMAAKILGHPVDIHGGGADLIFPHHESEIVQAERATGNRPFSRFWMHVAMVRYQGEKMSKSLGNLVMVRDLLNQGYSADDIRVLMVRYHYRKPWTFLESELVASAEISKKLLAAAAMDSAAGSVFDPSSYQQHFTDALEEDLNTPEALESLLRLAEAITESSNKGMDIKIAQRTLRELAGILGLRLDQHEVDREVKEGWSRHQARFAQ